MRNTIATLAAAMPMCEISIEVMKFISQLRLRRIPSEDEILSWGYARPMKSSFRSRWSCKERTLGLGKNKVDTEVKVFQNDKINVQIWELEVPPEPDHLRPLADLHGAVGGKPVGPKDPCLVCLVELSYRADKLQSQLHYQKNSRECAQAFPHTIYWWFGNLSTSKSPQSRQAQQF